MRWVLPFCVFLLLLSSSAGASERIVGGEPARAKDWPFLIALVNKYDADARKGLVCGGTLIRPRIVLTAAHCVWNSRPSDFRIIRGRSNLLSKGGQNSLVRRMKINPKYTETTWSEDLALLELQKPLRLERPLLEEAPPEGLFEIAGWGWNGTRYPARLRQTTVRRLSNERCTETYGSSFESDFMFCAGGEGQDACTNDSGGPIVQRGGGAIRLLGVVSWGGASCRTEPTVYAKLDIPWITATTERWQKNP